MATTKDKPFRFMDLPGELRNKIYGLLLCSFQPSSGIPYFDPSCLDLPAVRARNSIDATILRVSSQTHREAYDVMVKTNRFVLIRCMGGIPLLAIFKFYGIPIVTADDGLVAQFRGYVPKLLLGKKKAAQKIANPTLGPQSAMILFRDLNVLCEGLTKAEDHFPQFSTLVSLGLRLGSPRSDANPRYQDSIADFFSGPTQKALLNPFRAHIRGFPNMKVWGHVLPDLAKAIQDEVKIDRWFDPVQTLQTIRAKKELGTTQFRNGDMKVAYDVWDDTSVEVNCMRRSTSWSRLATDGGRHFVEQIAELQFTLFLNMANAAARTANTASTEAPPKIAIAIGRADEAMTRDFWQKGYTYEPVGKLLAKLRYRQAVLIRSQRNSMYAGLASTFIDHALELLPADPKIIEERQQIRDWRSTLNNEMEGMPLDVFEAVLGLLGGQH